MVVAMTGTGTDSTDPDDIKLLNQSDPFLCIIVTPEIRNHVKLRVGLKEGH